MPAIRFRPSLPKPPYELDEVTYNDPYTLEEMLKAIDERRDISSELTPPGRLLFLGLRRLDYCDEHRLLTADQLGRQARKLTSDYEVNKFNYELWLKTAALYSKMYHYEVTFRKTKRTDPQKALEAAQQILNLLYNLNEEL